MLTSAAGILALLDDEDELKVFALEKLDSIVDSFWAEIFASIQKIETLYEQEGFRERHLAALVASKVFYHVGSYEDALHFALCAEHRFDISSSSQFVTTIVAKCIDKYIELRSKVCAGEDVSLDPRLEQIVTRMFQRCFASGEYRQAAGIAFETQRLDMLEQCFAASGSTELLDYAFNVAQRLIHQRAFRMKILSLLADQYGRVAPKGYLQMTQCYIFLNRSGPVAGLLAELLRAGNVALALQLAFDVYDDAPQGFVAALLEAASSFDDSVASQEVRDRVRLVLEGKVTQHLHLDFLSRNTHTDFLILTATKDAVKAGSLYHNGTVIANGFMCAKTTSDKFLRDNKEWLAKANNWAKFSAVASLGVIHQGHVDAALTVMGPYLSQDSPYEKGGSLYALGLICANHGATVIDYLQNQLTATNLEVVQHGACLGLGLAALASGNKALFDVLKNVLHTDSAVAGEAAALAMGLVMLGSGDGECLADMLRYARDTQHEKIIRGLSMGIALVLYGLEEGADTAIFELCEDKDSLVRMSGVLAMGTAYVATGSNTIIRKLLHIGVSDVSDDVRRTAVMSLGFVLMSAPERLPAVIMLLSESFNPHVRYGSCLALAIACAGTGNKEAIGLIEPLVTDAVPFVRQAALVALALILVQAPYSHPKAASTRALFAKVIADKHEDPLARFGAIVAQGIIEAGGRNTTVSLLRPTGHVHMPSVVGLLVFSQFWFWFPLTHFLSLAFTPTALIAVNDKLQVPELSFLSNVAPSTFAYPPATQPPKEKPKEKVATAVLSISSKAKKKEDEVKPMLDNEAPKEEEKKEEKKEEKEPEQPFEILNNPARVVPPQVKHVSFASGPRYSPVKPIAGGVVVLQDSTPGEPESLVELLPLPGGAGGEKEVEAPEPFVFNPDEEGEN